MPKSPEEFLDAMSEQLLTQTGKVPAQLDIRVPQENVGQAPTINPTAAETWGAAFRIDNTVAAVAANEIRKDIRPTGFNAFDQLRASDIPEDYFSEFKYVNTQSEYDALVNQIRREQEDREIIANSGLSGILASMTAGIMSPTTFIPIGGALTAAAKTGSVLKTAATSSALGAGTMLADELILKANQGTRTPEEVAINTTAGALLAGAIGAGIGGLTKAQVKAVKDYTTAVASTDKSIGAAEYKPDAALTASKEQLELKGGTAFKAWKGISKLLHPSVRLADSPNVETRRVVHSLLNTGLKVEGHSKEFVDEAGNAVENLAFGNVEIALAKYRGRLAEALANENDLYQQYRKKDPDGALTWNQFREETGKAWRRGESHPIKEVADAAKGYETNLGEFVDSEARAVGLLKEDQLVQLRGETKRRVTRLWKPDTIVARQDEFSAKVREDVGLMISRRLNFEEARVRSEIKALQKGVDDLDAPLKAKLTKFQKEYELDNLETARLELIDEMEFDLRLKTSDEALRDYTNEAVEHIVTQMKGLRPYGKLPDVKMGARGPLKKRTFDVDDTKYEDFLVNDAGAIANYVARSVSPQIELKRMFGTTDFVDIQERLTKQHEIDLKQIEGPKERAKFQKQFKKEVRELRAMWQLVDGTYGLDSFNPDSLWVKGAAVAKTWNFTANMGEVALASISEFGTPVLANGFRRVFGGALPAMIKRMKQSPELKSASKRELRQMGLSIEAAMNGRLAELYHLHDPSYTERGLENILGKLSAVFSKYSGFSWVTDVTQEVSATATHLRILDGVKAKSISKKEDEFLNFLGLDGDMRSRIASMIDEHSEADDGFTLFNTDVWQDKGAVKAYQEALVTGNRNQVLLPGVGDRPLFVHNPTGSLLTQFTSWAISADQRLLLANLQDGDAGVLRGMAFMTGLGMLSYAIRETLNGRELPDDPTVWAAEGIDRAGLLTFLFWANGLTENFGIGLSQITGQAQSRRGYQPIEGDLLGPSFSLMQRAAKAAYTPVKGFKSDEELTEADIKNIQRLLPLAGIPVLRQIMDGVADNIEESLGIPQRSK